MPVHWQPVPWDGTPRDCGEIWRLRKGARVAVCRLFSHPIGAEVRLDVDGELLKSEARCDGLVLLDLALEWGEQAKGKGWR